MVQVYAQFEDGGIAARFFGTNYSWGEIRGARYGDFMDLTFKGYKHDGSVIAGSCQTTISWENGRAALAEVFTVDGEKGASFLHEDPTFYFSLMPRRMAEFWRSVRWAQTGIRDTGSLNDG